MTLPPGPFGCILADPPWAWISFSGKSGAPHRTEDAPYDVMSMDELRALPVADSAAKDCALIMWVIGSHLDQAIELGRHWGFTYKTDLFTWVKVGKHDPKVRPISMGKWSRKQTEQALIFTRGSPRRLDAGVRQLFETDEHVIFTPKREHSRKPEDQYSRIERLVGGPYLEMFARTRRDGWQCWGNEVDRFTSDFDALFPDPFQALLG